MAFEFSEVLSPAAPPAAEGAISRYHTPITVYIVYPLELVQRDKDEKILKELSSLGYGIMTIDGNDNLALRRETIPLSQFITDDLVNELLEGLPANVRKALKSAHDTYVVDAGPGLQKAGQIIEAIVRALHSAGCSRRWQLSEKTSTSAARLVDDLYGAKEMGFAKAEIGGIRSFLKRYRNAASHPAKNAKDAQKKIKGCKRGFEEACALARDLLAILKR